MRTIQEIDRDIDVLHSDLESRYPELRRTPKLHYGPTFLAACKRWQAAWDAHPDLHTRNHELYRERGITQLVRDARTINSKWLRDRYLKEIAAKYGSAVTD